MTRFTWCSNLNPLHLLRSCLKCRWRNMKKHLALSEFRQDEFEIETWTFTHKASSFKFVLIKAHRVIQMLTFYLKLTRDFNPTFSIAFHKFQGTFSHSIDVFSSNQSFQAFCTRKLISLHHDKPTKRQTFHFRALKLFFIADNKSNEPTEWLSSAKTEFNAHLSRKKEHKELLIYIIIFCLKKIYKAEYADVSILKRFVSSPQVVAREISETFNYHSGSYLLLSAVLCLDIPQSQKNAWTF